MDRQRMTVDELMDADPPADAPTNPEAVETAAVRIEPRVESRNERHRRELAERDERWAIKRAQEQVKQERERAEAASRDQADNAAVIERLTVIEQLLFDTMPAIDKMANGIERDMQALKLRVTEAETKSARLETRIAELQTKIVEASLDRGKTIDLPALPARMQ
jgi:hypothetical protein